MGQNDGFSKHCKNHIFCLSLRRGSEVIAERSKNIDMQCCGSGLTTSGLEGM